MGQTTNNVQAIREHYHPMLFEAEKSLLLDETAGRWLQLQRMTVKESSYIKYETIWRCHIQPTLGGMAVDTIGSAAAETLMQNLLEQGLAAGTVRDVLTVLRAILGYAAVHCGRPLPTLNLRLPRDKSRQMRVLSRAEQDRLIAYLRRDMDCCKFGVLLALLTGMRLGELCALQWKNVRKEERSIFINGTMQRLRVLDGDGGKKTRVVVSSPKTAAAVRIIPMSEKAAALCREAGEYGPECFVLTGTEKLMEPRAVQFRFRKYAEDCGLEAVHFHTLRHTFATRSVEVGFELKSLSEILGHSSTSITMNRYVHSSMELKRTNMDKLAQAGL